MIKEKRKGALRAESYYRRWHRWFAWHPIETNDFWAWLSFVERRLDPRMKLEPWEYRRPRLHELEGLLAKAEAISDTIEEMQRDGTQHTQKDLFAAYCLEGRSTMYSIKLVEGTEFEP